MKLGTLSRRRHAGIFLVLVVFGLAAAVFFGRRGRGPVLSTQANVLRIYAYSSFANSWGAGPELVKVFQEQTGTPVDLIDVGDSRMILNRMRLEGDRLAADLVLGLDQYSLEEARDLRKFESLTDLVGDVQWHSRLPNEARGSEDFLPFDWAPLSFVYRLSGKRAPTSLQDLRRPEWKASWVGIDPGTSGVGFQWLAWVLGVFGEDQGVGDVKSLMVSMKTVAPSWSGAYGLFQKKAAELAFTQITSVMYHRIEEKDFDYDWARLKEPHPYQVEYAGIPRTCVACKEAYEFLYFLLSAPAQKILMRKNYMLPVVSGVVDGSDFEVLEIPNLAPLRATGVKSARLLEIWKESVR